MSAVFECPRCRRPLGTEADPRPDPLPVCPDCGWRPRPAGESVWPNRLLVRAAGLNLGLAVLGLGAGWVCLHAHLFSLVALVVLGPGVSSVLGKSGGESGWIYALSYSVGILMGLLVFAADPNLGFALTVAMLSAAVGLVRSLFVSR